MLKYCFKGVYTEMMNRQQKQHSRAFRRTLTVLTVCLCMILGGLLSGCGASQSSLDPQHPITLSLWHIYGKNTDSPMNELVEEFNSTVGKERGIIINTVNVSRVMDITPQLLDAFADTPGALALPDLLFGHPSDVINTEPDRFLDWSELFTEEELSAYVDSFVEEGYVDEKLAVFPVSKSINVTFVNADIFDKFAADTGCTYEDLATWEGLYETADAYYDWSGGKSFCSVDYIFHLLQSDAVSEGEAFIGDDNWLNFDCSSFRKGWLRFAESAIRGRFKMADPFSTTDMLCGDAVCGIGSSAAILYFGDEVIYPDNRREDLRLKILPPPYLAGSVPSVSQAGAGLAAIRSEDDTVLSYAKGTVSDAKKEACGIFAAWLTEPARNLDFTVKTGYMPVTKEGFAAIADYDFPTSASRELHEVTAQVLEDYHFYIPAYVPGFDSRLNALYQTMRGDLKDCRSRFLSGEDAEKLARKSWEDMQ